MTADMKSFWITAMIGTQISNPLTLAYINVSEAEDIARNPLKEKYKNFDLPDNFSDDELVELDEWFKTKEL